jgi:hypothetical protein
MFILTSLDVKLLLAGCFYGILFDPGVGGSMFLRNITELLADYTAKVQCKSHFYVNF